MCLEWQENKAPKWKTETKRMNGIWEVPLKKYIFFGSRINEPRMRLKWNNVPCFNDKIQYHSYNNKYIHRPVEKWMKLKWKKSRQWLLVSSFAIFFVVFQAKISDFNLLTVHENVKNKPKFIFQKQYFYLNTHSIYAAAQKFLPEQNSTDE